MYIGSRYTDDAKKYYEALVASKVEELLDEEGNVTTDDHFRIWRKDTVDDSTGGSDSNNSCKRSCVKEVHSVRSYSRTLPVACWYAFKYIISSKLHTADDIRDAFHLMVLVR